MTPGADGLCGDVRLESEAKRGWVKLAGDAAELLAGLDYLSGVILPRHSGPSATFLICFSWQQVITG